MFFKRMELNGFKSFADPVTIEFTEGMTCIVGPNGSGKSNISDAVRWVLGEQSPKMLRGGKMEEVIFAGTQSRKPKGMAEVTLVIDNSDRVLPIDYAEVGISRRMYRSGESEYMINRTPCRLKDIRELIMDTGIGVEGYSIIGQGRIADIVSNKMDSRREIFEEAAGIVKYRNKRAETERKLASASSNLDRVRDIVSEIEGRIGTLEKDAEKAREYLDIKDKYRDVEINIIIRNIEAADDKAASVRTEMDEIRALLESGMAAREETEQSIRLLRERTQEADAALDDVRKRIASVTEEIHFIESREELSAERSASLERDRARTQAELSELREKLGRESSNLDGVKQSMREAEAEAEDAGKAAREKAAAAEAAAAELAEKERLLEEQKSAMLDLSSKAASCSAEIAGIDSLRSTLARRAERLKEEMEGSQTSEIEAKASAAQEELGRAEEARRGISLRLSGVSSERSRLEGELSRASRVIEDIRVGTGKLAARHKLLEELEKAYEGYGGAVRFLMQERLPGIVGTAGELLKVPRGWELAIETALGGNVQNVVCESEEAATAAIALLKERKAGRLTFLPADSIKPGRPADCADIASERGFLGMASDRVEIEGGYGNVVDYLLGRVAVCDKLENALAMSKKSASLRFVTLEGEHINPAGAITGGSFKNNTGNIISRKAEREELEARIKADSQALARAEQERAGIRADLEDAAKEEASLRERFASSETEAAVLRKEAEQLRSYGKEAKDEEGRRLTELAELEREMAQASENIRALEDYASGIKSSMEEAAVKASQLGDEAEAARAGFEKAQAAVTAARMEESAAGVRAGSVKELEKRLVSALSEISGSIGAKEKALEDIAAQREELESFSKDAGENLSDRKLAREALSAEEEALTEKKRAFRSEAEKLEEERSERDSRIYEHQVANHDAELRLARFDAQTDSLKEKLWEEFEMSYAQAADLADPDFVMSRGLRESREYRERLRALGDVNVGAIEEYKSVKERYEFLSAQRDDLNRAIDELSAVIKDIDITIKERFRESFNAVVDNFESTFTELFRGGHARLTLEDPSNPLESAIEIEAQPPGKKLQNMNLLSGGEKTMTAIALMFAVLKAKPTPFCILDEVEAALDDTNIDRVAKYLRKFADTQFALITHQKATMEYSDALYGVTMPEQGISKVLSLKLGESFDID